MPQLMPMMWVISGGFYLLVFLFGVVIFSLLEGEEVLSKGGVNKLGLFKWLW